ncbi:MAG: hypothetical protein AVDCRST_MAG79-2302 [uncultured Thermoleophilia bacterium]|uniref:Flagellar hook-associated protein 2 n=1 Tax=uncultured Thermoleophilia bacterium TaxID=1497501 RepID=A0A6J4UD00_9ACTN|nr:MAG: hypothetical protein AVDCRST_MAG79-2302 [uncultured Thermoleophilia bacterium]
MAAEGVNFTGLSSGVDTKSIVDQLMRLERIPITRVELRRNREEARQKALNEISTKISQVRAAADALRDPTFWNGGPKAVGGDDASYGVVASSTTVKSAYAVQVKQLAAADAWRQQATAGTSTLAASYTAPGVLADKTTKLTDLKDASGTSLGVAVGQTITFAATKGEPGSQTPVSVGYTVTATSTLEDLRAAVQTGMAGSTVTIEAGGRLRVQSAIGLDAALSDVSMTTGVAAFDTQFSAATVSSTTASGYGTVRTSGPLRLIVGDEGAAASALSFEVALTAGMTMAEVAARINASNGGVTAAVIDGRLQVTGSATGAASDVRFDPLSSIAQDLGFVAGGVPNPAAHVVTSRDAIVNVNGADVTSASNTATSIIPGATLTLKAVATSASTVTTDPLSVDAAEAEKRAKALVDAYNGAMDMLNIKMSEKSVTAPTNEVDRNKGTLFGSSQLRSVKDALQRAFGDVVTGLDTGRNTASSAGLSTGAIGTGVNKDTLAGRLTFDSATFTALFASDRTALRAIFDRDGATEAEDGIAQRLSDVTKLLTQTGGTLQSAIAGSGTQVSRLQTRITEMTTRLTATESRLKTQFLAMERAISQLNASRNSLAALPQPGFNQ